MPRVIRGGGVSRETPPNEPLSVARLRELAELHQLFEKDVVRGYARLSALHQPPPIGAGLPWELVNQLLVVGLEGAAKALQGAKEQGKQLTRLEVALTVGHVFSEQAQTALATAAEVLARGPYGRN